LYDMFPCLPSMFHISMTGCIIMYDPDEVRSDDRREYVRPSD
jgi:hypothetical protein